MTRRTPAPERGSYEWRQRDRMLSRYLVVRDAVEGTPERREALRLEGRLVAAYEPLVGRALGAQMERIPVCMEALAKADDLRTVGLFGLLRALRNWEDRGYGFAGYAIQMVRWEMLHELRALGGLKERTRHRVVSAIRAARAVEARAGRGATEEEAANEAGISVERYRELVALDRRSRYVEPLPEHDGPHSPISSDEPGGFGLGFGLGQVYVHKGARWLLRHAGRECVREIAALYAAGEWGGVDQPEAWRNDRSIERGSGVVRGVYELPEVGGAAVRIATDLDTNRTHVVADSMPEWVRDLMDGTGTERWRAA